MSNRHTSYKIKYNCKGTIHEALYNLTEKRKSSKSAQKSKSNYKNIRVI